MARISATGWFRNTPTVMTSLGMTVRIARAVSRSTYRREVGTKLRPIASAPASTAARESTGWVMPQIFTNTPGRYLHLERPACGVVVAVAFGRRQRCDDGCGGVRDDR